ncbi:MAG TPA: hypothetical protein VK648_03450, partial [Gemmatimonadaceae bacterium]|nr:hypothetical protein [Gemmatimonadaceae bacterium]
MSTKTRGRSRSTVFLIVAALLFADANAALARVVRIEIVSRVDISGTFAGRAYERIAGRVYFAFDPLNPANAQIVDLQ